MTRNIALRIKKEKSEKHAKGSKTIENLPYEGVRNISFFMQGSHNDDLFQVYVSIDTICMDMTKYVAFYVTLLFVICFCMFF